MRVRVFKLQRSRVCHGWMAALPPAIILNTVKVEVFVGTRLKIRTVCWFKSPIIPDIKVAL